MLKWGLGGFAPDKRGVGDAPPLAVGTPTLCLPCRSGMPRTAGKHLATASAGVLLWYSSLIKKRTTKNFHAVALLTFALTMQALFVVGNVSRRLSEELPLVNFFLYIGVPPSQKILTGV